MTRDTSVAGSLWPHQREAVKRMAQYVASNPRPCDVAGLVTMPTGTGKTAVVAGIIDSGKRQGHWLVLVPRTALVRQLSDVLDDQLWRQLGTVRPAHFPAVRRLPTTPRISELAEITTPTVFVDTIQKLVQIDKMLNGDDAQRDALFSRFNAVLIDEGHYEPSPTWSAAARSLQLPVVLFTATPYRNDELHFQINSEHRYSYHYFEAIADERLREPRFASIAAGTTEQFIDDTIDFVSRRRLGHARIIIRCTDHRSITNCVDRLRERGQSAIGIHDHFVNSDRDYLTDKVPAPEDTHAQYWVHQYKLMEGIDDPAFRVVAFHDPLNNDRSVIQQIGRALRRPAPNPKTAWVLSREGFDASQVWDRYLHFDRNGGTSTAMTPEFTQCLLDAQPVAAYYDTQFRAPVDLANADLWKQFAYQPAAYILRSPAGRRLSPAQLAEDIVEEYDRMGLVVQRPMLPDAQTVVISYVSIGNSDTLLTGLFLEGALGYTVVRLINDRVYLFDTQKRLPKSVREQANPESRTTLSKLLDPDTRVTKVSLDNTDINRRAIRSRSISAASINDVAPGLTDYAFVCSTAEGYTPNSSLVSHTESSHTARYVGLSRARLRDGRHIRLTFAQFCEWTATVDSLLDDDQALTTETLGRYAEAVDIPADPSPRHVLVDVDPEDYVRIDAGGTVHNLELDWLATDVIDGSTKVTVDDQDLPATVRWDSTNGRYRLESTALQHMDFRYQSDQGRELTATINADQLLRVVPHSPGLVYVHGQFMGVPDPHTDQTARRLLDRITGVAALAKATEEKGEPDGDGWESQTVFGIIDKLASPARNEIPEMAEYFESIEMLVCTDMGTEPCDFIAMQSNRIAFIHAKHGGGEKGTKRSATVFHEVVGQAIKNLVYLMPQTQDPPPIAEWDRGWPSEGTQKGVVRRLRSGQDLTAQQIWDRARSLVQDVNVYKEVWIVLGKGMSLDSVRAELEKEHPADQIIQIYALLQSAASTVAEVGAQLRIFCSP